MEILEVRRILDIWLFVQECMKAGGLWNELIHGGRHMRHVLREAETLIAECELDASLAKCLGAATAVHDLGRLGAGFAYPGVSEEQLKEAIDAARIDRNNPKYVDHAHLSAQLFRLMPIEDMSSEEKEAVFRAVRDHSIGLVGKGIPLAETLEEKILGLLVVCDHCGDAASPDGAARAIRALKGKPVLSTAFSAADLEPYMLGGCPIIPVSEAGKYKGESVLAHLVYNYQASWPILSVVRHLLTQRYWDEEVMPRQLMYGSVIEPLLRLQKSIRLETAMARISDGPSEDKMASAEDAYASFCLDAAINAKIPHDITFVLENGIERRRITLRYCYVHRIDEHSFRFAGNPEGENCQTVSYHGTFNPATKTGICFNVKVLTC